MNFNVKNLDWHCALISSASLKNEKYKGYDDECITDTKEIPDFLIFLFEGNPNCEVGEKIDITVENLGKYVGVVKDILKPEQVEKIIEEKIINEIEDDEKLYQKIEDIKTYLSSSYQVQVKDIEYKGII